MLEVKFSAFLCQEDLKFALDTFRDCFSWVLCEMNISMLFCGALAAVPGMHTLENPPGPNTDLQRKF